MNKVFLDVNVILDVLQAREPDFAASAEILQRAERDEIRAFVCASSFGIIHYVLERHLGAKKSIAALKKLSKIVKIATLTEPSVNEALDASFEDFEDALQYFSAKAVGAESLITRNKRDFRPAKIPVLTPEEYLAFTREKRKTD